MKCQRRKWTTHHYVLIILLFYAQARRNYAGDAPTITEHPLDILVVKDDPVTLRCAANGDGVQISWYKDGQLVNVGNGHRLLLPNGSLFLLKVNNGGKDSDAGTYYCIAKNEYGEVRSQEANVKIAMLREEFRVRPRTVTAIIGNRVTMECSPPRGFPEPVVTWKKDEKELNIQDEKRISLHPSGNLIIENVQRTDAGFYQCVATNMVGEKTSSPARLSVYEKPRIVKEPKDTVVDVNLTAFFDCYVVGEPTPAISWKKKNDQMPVDRAYITPDNRGLRIDRVQASDEGEYVCHAKNPAGNVEMSARLRVNSPPVFLKTPQDLRLNNGRSAVFECAAAGQPAPGIFWSKEGDQHFTYFPGLTSADGRIQVTMDGRLVIDDVRPSDQGNYVCAAMNAAGSTLTKASLKMTSTASPSLPPPVIQYGHQNQTLMVNDMAILPCQSAGRTPVHISWLRNGQLLNLTTGESGRDERYRQLTTGTLQISDLRKSDSGVYTCRARNDDGEATWTASLLVEEHTNPNTMFQRMPDAAMFPAAPGKPIIVNVTSDSVELEWTSPDRHGATPVNGYLLQYWSPDLTETWENIPDAIPSVRFRVKRLRSNHTYVFIVRAENGIGIGPPSPISEPVTTRSATLEMSRSQLNDQMDLETARQKLATEQLIKLVEVKSINATAMLLSWKRQRREPLVQGYYIKWRGPPLTPDHSWVNITDATTESVIINGLKPFTNYEFFVIPYHRSIQGMPSNSLDGTTHEAPPSLSPSSVKVRMMNLTTLRVSWRPPPSDGINGVLKGFQIHINGNASLGYDRNITTNERAASVTLFNLLPGSAYQVHVAARTSAGVGTFYKSPVIIMNEETLSEHLRLQSEAGESTVWTFLRRPQVVAIGGLTVWGILIGFVLLVCYRWCKHRSNKSATTRAGMPFIKINDGSVMYTARNAFWMDQSQLARTNAASSGQATPNGCDFYGDGSVPIPYGGACDGPYNGTMNRQSPHHYHYAQLPEATSANHMASFYGRHEYQDDPSPYATTTLDMNSQSQLRRPYRPSASGTMRGSGPALPSNPVPPGPPEHFLSTTAAVTNASMHRYAGSCGTISGVPLSGKKRTAAGALLHRCSPPSSVNAYHHSHSDLYSRQNSNGAGRCTGCGGPSSSGTVPQPLSSDSPPHTDVSYIQSSDGTSGSSKAAKSLDRRSPPENILDFLPPPPLEEPPNEAADMYDAVSDCLLPQTSSRDNLDGPRSVSTRTPGKKRIRNGRRRSSREYEVEESSRYPRDRSENDKFLANEIASYDSEADGEVSENDGPFRRSIRSPNSAGGDISSYAHRPSQPCMGINASTITQNSHDSIGAGNRRSTSRIKSLPRNGRTDHV